MEVIITIRKEVEDGNAARALVAQIKNLVSADGTISNTQVQSQLYEKI